MRICSFVFASAVATLVSLPIADLNAAIVSFSWDATTNTGTLSSTVTTGSGPVTVTAPLAAPNITTDDGGMIPAGYDGYQNDFSGVTGGIPGTTAGTHYGWSGTVNLTGIILGVGTYTLPVDLIFEAGDSISYSFDAIDESTLDAGDVTGTTTYAGWAGDYGSGHRYSAAAATFVAGADSFSLTSTRTIAAAETSTIGDSLGISIASRDSGLNTSPSTVYFDNFQFSGTLAQPDSDLVFTPVPEPSSAIFMGAGLMGALLRRRR
jgi:hypothetical protein